MEAEQPDNLFTFRGKSYDLHLANVGELYMLLVATEADGAKQAGKITASVRAAVSDILRTLNKLGISTVSHEIAKEPVKKQVKEKAPSGSLSDPELEVVLAKNVEIKKEDADAFWEIKPDEEAVAGLASGDSLTYEQAKQLGLAPEED
jgi:hypothetical protein